MKIKKIVITGGPGTGKTSVVKELEAENHYCLHEISRQITLEAQKKGISQLFLQEPLLFSELLLEGRIQQFMDADNLGAGHVFIDRGIPDVVAYMDYFGNDYPPVFKNVCNEYKYHSIFLLPPWKEIYVSDNERYESFEQACIIHGHLKKSYEDAGYAPIEVPTGSLKERKDFILSHLQ